MKTLKHVAVLMMLTSSVAYAHTELSASMPADEAALEAAPKEVMLHFSEAVRLTALSLTKRGEAKQDLSPLPAGAMKDFSVAAPALAAGEYLVAWRALSEDAHVMTGEFSFTVGMTSSEGHHSDHAESSPHVENTEHSQSHGR